MNFKKDNIFLLDCTLRDGGYYTNWDFSEELITSYFEATNKLPIKYIEIGYLSREKEEYHGAFFYLPTSLLKRCKELSSHKLSVMLNEKDIDTEEEISLLLNDSFKNYIDLIRLAVKPENIKRAIKLGEHIKKKGYKIALNLMYASEWENDYPESNILSEINETFDYFYLVDSYGGMFPESVTAKLNYLKETLKIPIGFHGHNNLELALANALMALDSGAKLIDSTILGMGRGAGNLKTELLLSVLQTTNNFKFDFDILNSLVDTFFDLKEKYEWGTNLSFMVSGIKSLPQDAVMSQVKKRYFSLNGFTKPEDFSNSFSKKSGYKINKKYTKAILIGGGHSVPFHAKAIKEFIQSNSDILVIYSSSRNVEVLECIKNDQFHFLAGNEGKRLEETLHTDIKKNRIAILPPDFFSVLNFLPESFSKQILYLEDEKFEKKYGSSMTALILQFCINQDIKSVYLAGYDGYGNSMTKQELELFEENSRVFQDFQNKIELQSVTPTEYGIKSKSIYKLI